ncbi:MAG: repeat-containing protein [Mucilaginibacter sp.]|jgi:sugar lactone lactonase YvrE|nr:repeat-containing protein [Mucilaginibacter sp.]
MKIFTSYCFICMKNPLYRILFLPAFFLSVLILVNGCKKSSTTTSSVTIPTVITDGTIINVTSTTAQSGGIVTSFNNGVITANGVCYSKTNTTPTIADSKTTEPIVNQDYIDAPFTSNITGLTPNTLYYLRAYVTNSAGTGYGSVIKFTTGLTLTSLTGTVTTFAGNGAPGYADGTGLSASFNSPQGVAVDSKGNVFVADSYNHCIREITPAGVVTTFAGNQTIGQTDGPAATAQFYAPKGLTFDSQGNLFVADYGNNVIRKITPAGIVSTYAGNGTAGLVDGSTANLIEFNGPAGVAFDAAGNLYVADRGNNVVRKITTAGAVSVLAGTNNTTRIAGYLDATDLVAAFHSPNSVAVDASANVYVTDQLNAAIRKITSPAGVTTTLAGGPSQLSLLNIPSGLAIDGKSNLFLTDETGRVMEYTSANVLYILAGSANVSGFVNGAGATAQFNNPQGIAIDANGNIYVADQGNNCIRKITITTTN